MAEEIDYDPLPMVEFSEEQLTNFEDFLNRQVIPDPTEELLKIYEKRILHEMSYLRAEKFDSPEWAEELKKIQAENDDPKVPRNIQNPNYDRLISFYRRLQEPKLNIHQAIQILIELHEFMSSFKFAPAWELQIGFLPTEIDPRCFQESPPLFMCYLLTKVQHRLTKRELSQFQELTQGKFDQESLEESLEYLKDSREPPRDYENLGNQIFGAMISKNDPKPPKYQLEPDPSKVPTQPEEADTLSAFLDYLYYSRS